MAASNQLVKEIQDQFLMCKICCDVYTHPKTLTCFHSYCLACLQKHVDSTRDRGLRVYSRFVTCPQCRSKTEIPTGGLRKLPDNFLLSNLTEVLQKKSRRHSLTCDICPTVKTKSNKACSKCIECSKVLCTACVDLHRSTNVTNNHNLVDLKGQGDIQCKVHIDEVVRFYCEPCEMCICVVCTFTDHKDHEISSFKDVDPKYKSSMVQALKLCRDRLEELKKTMTIITTYETSITEARDKIRDCAINNIRCIRQTERKLLKDLDDMATIENVADFLKNKEWIQRNLDTLQDTCNITQVLADDGKVAMLLLMNEIKSRLSDLLNRDLPNIPESMKQRVIFWPAFCELGCLQFEEILTYAIENTESPHSAAMSDIKTKNILSASDTIRKGMDVEMSFNELRTDKASVASSTQHRAQSCQCKQVQTEIPSLLNVEIQVTPEHSEVSTNTTIAELCHQASQISPLTLDKSTNAIQICFDAETSTLELSSLHPLLSSKIVSPFLYRNDLISNKGVQTENWVEPIISLPEPSDAVCNLAPQEARKPSITTICEDAPKNELSSISNPVHGPVYKAEVCDIACDPIFVEPNFVLLKQSFAMDNLIDQETMTDSPVAVDSSIQTNVVQCLDCSSCTDPIFTRNIGTVTLPVLRLDQFTNTEIVVQRDAETSLLVETTEHDTLTEQRIYLHAETGTDYLKLRDSYTWMDMMSTSCNSTMTDADEQFYASNDINVQCDSVILRRSNSKDTEYRKASTSIDQICCQTTEVASNPCRCDTKASCFTEKATSTESLLYMGLAGEFDKLDQLFPRWSYSYDNSSIVTSATDISLETDAISCHVVTIDQAVSTDDMFVSDTATQTQLTSSAQTAQYGECDLSPESYILCDLPEFATKSAPRSIRASWHSADSVFASTAVLAMSDSMDRWTNTARMARRSRTPPNVTSDKATSTDNVQLIDKVTMTTCYGVKDERMAECITKLKHVKETLSGRETGRCKVSPEKRHSAELTKDERRKVLDDMLRETYSVQMGATDNALGRNRRPQPITTLKSNVRENAARNANNPSARDTVVTGVKMGRHAVRNSGLSNSISAPGSTDDVALGAERGELSPPRASLEQAQIGDRHPSLPAITEMTSSTNLSDDVFLDSTDSLSSCADMTEGSTTNISTVPKPKRSKSTSFVQKLLSRRQKADKKAQGIPKAKFNKDEIKPNVESAKTNVLKKPSSFVYMRQRLFPVHHDSNQDNITEPVETEDNMSIV